VIDLVSVLQESLKAQSGGKKKAAPKKAKPHKKAA
jgi:non-homologous end joining protein Ku